MEIREHVPLADHTTLRLGGSARYFASATSVEELRDALAFARERGLPHLILGGGSNMLLPDEGWHGLVIRIEIKGCAYEENTQGDARLSVGAGVSWDELVLDTTSQGLSGMENLSGIPGTVGATPVQNVGAYGVEVRDIIDWVEVLDSRTGELHILSVPECAFAYRDSIFKHEAGAHLVVTRVAFRLSTHPRLRLDYADLRAHFGDRTDVSVSDVRKAILEIRARKFPDLRQVGCAGSFFKNPIISRTLYREMKRWVGDVPCYEVDEGHVKIPLAWVLEKYGWKGKRHGAVGCWDTQPLVLVHYGGGTAGELILFAREIMADVKKHTSIKLEPEVAIVTNAPRRTARAQ